MPVICIPEDQLAAEIEFAVAYAVAAGQQRARGFLMPEPDDSRRYFAGRIAAMLTERAAGWLSGMTRYELRAGEGNPGAG